MALPSMLYPGPNQENLACIPAGLKAVPQWVLWRGVYRPYPPTPGQKVTKVPIDPHSLTNADVTDPLSWGAYDICVAALPVALEEWQLDPTQPYVGGGVGYVLSDDDPFYAVDLDGCIDPTTGTIADWAQQIVTALNTYTEISQGQAGLHLMGEGVLPTRGRRKGKVEMYDSARFMVMTGWQVPGTPSTIEPRQTAINNLWCNLFAPQVGENVWTIDLQGNITNAVPSTIMAIAPAPSGELYAQFAGTTTGWPWVRCELARNVHSAATAVSATDEKVIAHITAASNAPHVLALASGEWQQDYDSQSEADLALCCHLAFWTRNAAQIDRLFRQTRLMRAKWDERRGAQTYGERTIAEALARQTDYYAEPATFATSHNGTTPQMVWGSVATQVIVTQEWTPPPPLPWPTIDEKAYYGLAGKIAKTLRPQTESDPIAVLVQLLVMFGNVIGHHAHFQVEATLHHTNLDAAIVGATSKSRKGTSVAHVRRILRAIDRAWSLLTRGGLSSGEGLIWHVRDAVWKNAETCIDEGVQDKRLCIVEEEFARALTKKGIEGNILSHVMREAWDHGDLYTLVSGRHKGVVHATNAHVSIIGHITLGELRRLITDVDASNGFANRFLWVCAKRSNILPGGGKYPDQELAPLREELEQAITFATKVERMERSPEAETRWEELYKTLATEQPGLLGELTARAEAQVLRLSCLYALLDQTAVIEAPHLEAASALWDYCAASARYIFGDIFGDPLADDIKLLLEEAGETGMTRTDIHNALGRNMNAASISRALITLYEAGMARATVERTGGRSAERWRIAHA